MAKNRFVAQNSPDPQDILFLSSSKALSDRKNFQMSLTVLEDAVSRMHHNIAQYFHVVPSFSLSQKKKNRKKKLSEQRQEAGRDVSLIELILRSSLCVDHFHFISLMRVLTLLSTHASFSASSSSLYVMAFLDQAWLPLFIVFMRTAGEVFEALMRNPLDERMYSYDSSSEGPNFQDCCSSDMRCTMNWDCCICRSGLMF